MSQKNLWPKKLQELNDVAPMWPAEVLPGSVLVVNEDKSGFKFGTPGGEGEKGDPGPEGPEGPPNVLSIGTVTKHPTTAEVTITGDSPNQVLNFVLPQGDPGVNGTDGTDGTDGQDATNPNFSIGGVNTGTAAVVLTGTYPDLAINFTLPEGAPGTPGATGPANTLTIGTVTVGATADATITGEAPNQVLSLVLPPGPKGIDGTTAAPVVEVIASRDIASSDEASYLRSTSATAVSLTVPLDLVTDEDNAEFHIRQAGAGLVTIVAASGVTVNAPFGGTLALAGQGATVTIKRVATNEYDLFGLVEPAP